MGFGVPSWRLLGFGINGYLGPNSNLSEACPTPDSGSTVSLLGFNFGCLAAQIELLRH